jgi:hypothetical protein
MREYEIEQTSLTFIWTFDRMLPSLPAPGTPAFAILCKLLHPYGLTSSKITGDAPTSRLSDTVIRIILLDNRLGIKIKFNSVEVFCDDLFEGDEKLLLEIVNSLFAALREIDEEVLQGKVQIRISTHLGLKPRENFSVICEHLTSIGEPNFIPEAAIYQVKPETDSAAKALRVFISNSVVYKDALFAEVSADYENVTNMNQFAESVEKDFYSVIGMLGLKERQVEV